MFSLLAEVRARARTARSLIAFTHGRNTSFTPYPAIEGARARGFLHRARPKILSTLEIPGADLVGRAQSSAPTPFTSAHSEATRSRAPLASARSWATAAIAALRRARKGGDLFP